MKPTKKDKWNRRQKKLAAANKEQEILHHKRMNQKKVDQLHHDMKVAESKGFTPGPIVKKNHYSKTGINLTSEHTEYVKEGVQKLRAEAKELEAKIAQEEANAGNQQS